MTIYSLVSVLSIKIRPEFDAQSLLASSDHRSTGVSVHFDFLASLLCRLSERVSDEKVSWGRLLAKRLLQRLPLNFIKKVL